MAHASIITRKTGTLRHVVIWRDAEHGRKCAEGCTSTDHQHSASFATSAEAKTKRTEVDAKLAAGERATETGETFGQAADRWLAAHTGSQETRSIYRSALDLHLTAYLGRKLRDVANDRSAAQATIATHPRARVLKTVLTAVCDCAVQDGRITGHRLSGLKLSRTQAAGGRRDIVPATHAQLCTVADRLGQHGLSVWIMRGCGLRIAECLAVDSADFRDGYSTLRVSRQQHTADGTIRPLKHKAAGEYRDIPVPAWLATLVKRHIMAHGQGRLFTVSYSRYITLWRAAVKVSGLPVTFTPHQCRHAYATALLSQGIPITDVARWMGHANIAITFRTYSHLLPDAAESARKALDSEWEAFRVA